MERCKDHNKLMYEHDCENRPIADEYDLQLLNSVIRYANRKHDGHFTIMKFTTNWRGCFGTTNVREDIDNMLMDKTLYGLLEKMNSTK